MRSSPWHPVAGFPRLRTLLPDVSSTVRTPARGQLCSAQKTRLFVCNLQRERSWSAPAASSAACEARGLPAHPGRLQGGCKGAARTKRSHRSRNAKRSALGCKAQQKQAEICQLFFATTCLKPTCAETPSILRASLAAAVRKPEPAGGGAAGTRSQVRRSLPDCRAGALHAQE